MLDLAKVNQIAREAAIANLTQKRVTNILSEPAIDSEGHEALRITIVIPPGVAPRLKGDAILNTLAQIQDRLRAAGEERFPIVEYATQEELDSIGDSES